MDKSSRKILIVAGIILILIILLALYFDRGAKSQELKNLENVVGNKESALNSSESGEVSSSLSASKQVNKNMENNNDKNNYTLVTLDTSLGQITFELAKDKPKTTENFLKLAKSGFYNGVKFHRVIPGFMIQTGDPLSKDDTKQALWGTGGPGYEFQDELTGDEKYTMGTVAMANSGPNTNGSQFFIMTSNTQLPPLYTVFGKVLSGQDIANQIQEVKTDSSDRPLEAIVIKSIDLK